MNKEKPITIEQAIKDLETLGYKLIESDNKKFCFIKECSLYKKKTYFCIDIFKEFLSFSFYFMKRLTKTHQKYVIATPRKEAHYILNLLDILREVKENEKEKEN